MSKYLPDNIIKKCTNNKNLTMDETVRLCMWAYFGAKGSVNSNRTKNFINYGCSIEEALKEAYSYGFKKGKENKND